LASDGGTRASRASPTAPDAVINRLVLRSLPGFVLDLGYRVIAAVRYRLWGHADACQLVTPAQRRRFKA
jgi:predicted DCC family thiol-disulfide oxidoreductase YuxK